MPLDQRTLNQLQGIKPKGLSPRTNIPKETLSIPGHPADPIAKLGEKWTRRVSEWSNLGIKPKDIAPLIRFDAKNVKAGRSAMSENEALNALTALKKGHGIVEVDKEGGGFDPIGAIGNAIQDVGDIAGSLPQIPSTLAKEARDLQTAIAEGDIKLTGEIHDPATAFKNLSKVPGVRLLPGIYTGKNITSGDFGEIQKHPVFTLLDVLPLASGAGKLATAGKPAAVGSATEALQAGKPLTAIARTKLPENLGGKNLIEVARDLPGIGGKSLGITKEVRESIAKKSTIEREGARGPVSDQIRAQLEPARENLLAQARSIHDEFTSKGLEVPEPIKKTYAKTEAQVTRLEQALQGQGTAEWGIELGKDYGLTQPRFSNSQLESYYASKNPTIPRTQLFNTVFKKDYIPLSDFLRKFPEFRGAHATTLVDNELSSYFGSDLAKGASEVFIPRYIDKAYNIILKERTNWGNNPALKIFDKSSDVFKYAVLSGPRHFTHILFSNLMFTLLERGPLPLRYMRQAWDMVRDPEHWISGLPRSKESLGIYSGKKLSTVDEALSIAQGKQMGSLVKDNIKATGKFLGKPVKTWVDVWRHWEEMTQDMFRAMDYLDQTKGKGLLHDDAVLAVRKILLDVDGMAPIERVVLRRVMPFYAFTRHLISYMFRYPANHPLRAAVLANIGRIETEDQSSGLPRIFDDIFFLGSPDKQGNVATIDIKNINPFRSIEGQNPFTLGGFMSSLNPALTVLPQMAGLDILSATPELYPELTVDPESGQLVARHPDAFRTAIETYLPPTRALDAIFTWSDDMKRLRESNPDAYRRAIWSSLNLPFTPSLRNIPEEKIKFANRKYQIAQQDAGLGKLENYKYLPFGGKIYPRKELEKILAALNTQLESQGVMTNG